MKSLFAFAVLSACSVSSYLKADVLEERVNLLENSVRGQAVQIDLLRGEVDKLKTQVAALPTPIGLIPRGTMTYHLKSNCSEITTFVAFSDDYYILKLLGEKQCGQAVYVSALMQLAGGTTGILTAEKADIVYFKP